MWWRQIRLKRESFLNEARFVGFAEQEYIRNVTAMTRVAFEDHEPGIV